MLNGHAYAPTWKNDTNPPDRRNCKWKLFGNSPGQISISEALALVTLITKAVFFLRDEMTILELKQPLQEAVK
jgi:hypothetical protein